MRTKRLLFIGVIALMIASCGGSDETATSNEALSLPSVTEIPYSAGTHGNPYDAVPKTNIINGKLVPQAPVIDLNALGYVEREFQMSGGATVYKQGGMSGFGMWGGSGTWGSNGRWSVAVASSNVPYTTRLLVRYPTNPAKFNGTVIVDWSNVITGGDQDPLWANIYEEVFRGGYAYALVTAQKAGISEIKTWDPVRYGQLSISTDGQSYDIFSQAAQVIRAKSATLLGGLTPLRFIGTGDSLSAIRLTTYVNAIQPVAKAYDGFLLVGRAGPSAPIGDGLISTNPIQVNIRTDNAAKMIQLDAEGDIVDILAALARQPDNNYLRTWEVAGAAHIDDHEATYEIACLARDQPNVPVPQCAFGTPITGTGTALDGINAVNNMPLHAVEKAALNWLQRWLTTGAQPPHFPYISTTSFFFNLLTIVQHDQYGNALGGIRLPDITVPIETYQPVNIDIADVSSFTTNPLSLFTMLQSLMTLLQTSAASPGDYQGRSEGLCLLSGYYVKLSSSTLKSLYPNAQSYVSKYTAAADAAVTAGYLLPPERDTLVANATKVAKTLPIPQ
jgi:hypothetical protein